MGGAWFREWDQGGGGRADDEFKRRLPQQRKTQRDNLALLVATMLEVRSANLMDLAASLPREAERTDMRYQWIARGLSNPLIDPDAVMAPFAAEVLERAAAEPGGIVLILNQSKLSERHQVVMLAVRYGERALPLAWRGAATASAIGFATQRPARRGGAVAAGRRCGVSDGRSVLRQSRFDRPMPDARIGLSVAAQSDADGQGRLWPDHDGGAGEEQRFLP